MSRRNLLGQYRMFRILWIAFLGPFLVTAAVLAAALILNFVLLGERSPGMFPLLKWGMDFWIPLLVLVCFVVPSVSNIRGLIRTKNYARTHGLTLSDFLSLSKEQKADLKRDNAPST